MKMMLAVMLALPLAAMAQPADRPLSNQKGTEPNPKANRYAEVPGFFKLPAGHRLEPGSPMDSEARTKNCRPLSS